MAHHNDLTARRYTTRLKLIYARTAAAVVLVGAALAADALHDGALNMPWLWGGMAALLVIYHTLTALTQRLLIGWERRKIRDLVGQPDKRAVTTLKAIQVVDLNPQDEPPAWLDDHTPRRQQPTYS